MSLPLKFSAGEETDVFVDAEYLLDTGKPIRFTIRDDPELRRVVLTPVYSFDPNYERADIEEGKTLEFIEDMERRPA